MSEGVQEDRGRQEAKELMLITLSSFYLHRSISRPYPPWKSRAAYFIGFLFIQR